VTFRARFFHGGRGGGRTGRREIGQNIGDAGKNSGGEKRHIKNHTVGGGEVDKGGDRWRVVLTGNKKRLLQREKKMKGARHGGRTR